MRFILSEFGDIPTGKTGRVLDAGCGTGGLLRRLAHRKAWGVEIASEGIRFCRQRGLDNILQASVTELPFRPNSFDVVLSIDVLVHQWVAGRPRRTSGDPSCPRPWRVRPAPGRGLPRPLVRSRRGHPHAPPVYARRAGREGKTRRFRLGPDHLSEYPAVTVGRPGQAPATSAGEHCNEERPRCATAPRGSGPLRRPHLRELCGAAGELAFRGVRLLRRAEAAVTKPP